MPTIDSKEIVDIIVSGNGLYPGDENSHLGPVVRVTEYTNAFGNRTWGIVYEREAKQGLW